MTARRLIETAFPLKQVSMDSTFAVEFLPSGANCPIFLNADLIATGLSPFHPNLAAVRAGRLMLQQIDEHVRRGDSFAFETTSSGRGYARRIPRWQAPGYRVKLFFLGLPTPEMAIARVAHRVEGGGHDAPNPMIIRWFSKGWCNSENVYRNLVDDWKLYDNAGSTPMLLAEGGTR